jgi:hypothetical protein
MSAKPLNFHGAEAGIDKEREATECHVQAGRLPKRKRAIKEAGPFLTLPPVINFYLSHLMELWVESEARIHTTDKQ